MTNPTLPSLPPAPQPVGNYVPVVQTGNLLYTSGMIPTENGQVKFTGQVGGIAVSIEDGQAAARLCILNALSAIQAYLGGSFDRIERVVKVTGFVNSVPGFVQQPQVINAASDLLVEFFGEQGKHARASVGVAGLPLDASVEIELILALKS